MAGSPSRSDSPGISGASPARAPRTSTEQARPLLPRGADRPGSGGSSCGVTMLPLSTIEGQETEEVQTKPPEKGALPSENPGEAPRKPPRKNARVSARRVPICPMPSVCFTFYMESNDSDFESQSSPATSKPGSKCTSPSKPRAKYQEIQAWECPLCCLSILYLS
ncbi:uncharacterized protein AAG666_004718 [Megaptera novaeangliae]